MIKIRTSAAVVLGAVGLSVIGALEPAAPPARADNSTAWTANQDTIFVALCASNGIHNTLGPAAEAAIGEQIATELMHGVPPIAERNLIYRRTNDTVSLSDANVMVNAAKVAYLGAVLMPNGQIG